MNIKLRPFVENDAIKLFDLSASNPIPKTTTTFWRPWALNDFKNYIEKSAKHDSIKQCICLIDNEMEIPVGAIELNHINWIHGRAELGIFILSEEHKNKGIGKSVVDRITNFAFNSLRLQRIYCKVFSDNEYMLKILKSCNYEKEGVWRKHFYVGGKYIDAILFGKLKDGLQE